MRDERITARPTQHAGSTGEVLAAFAKLGVIAFGGPIAHLGYFRDEFVIRRRWLKEAAVAVVAQAVFGMAKTLTPDRNRATIAGGDRRRGGFVLLVLWRAPPWSVVGLLAIGGFAVA